MAFESLQNTQYLSLFSWLYYGNSHRKTAYAPVTYQDKGIENTFPLSVRKSSTSLAHMTMFASIGLLKRAFKQELESTWPVFQVLSLPKYHFNRVWQWSNFLYHLFTPAICAVFLIQQWSYSHMRNNTWVFYVLEALTDSLFPNREGFLWSLSTDTSKSPAFF